MLPGQPRTVALLGATGMVGGFLLREVLARGHEVRVLARSPEKLAEFAGRVTIIEGDARDAAAIQALVQGSDVVISALGPVRGDGDAALFINTTATEHVLAALADAGISRYIVVSGAAVVVPGDERGLLGWWIRLLVRIGLASELEDKQAEYAALALSDAAWTLVRCPLIDSEPFLRAPLVSLRTPPAFRLRAGELARFLVDQIEADDYLRAAPFIGSQPR